MKYLGTLGIIFIYRLKLQNHQPNSGTKSTYSMWITLPKPLVTEKRVASNMDQREYVVPCAMWQIFQNPKASLLLCK